MPKFSLFYEKVCEKRPTEYKNQIGFPISFEQNLKFSPFSFLNIQAYSFDFW